MKNHVRRLREELSLSQSELGKRVGVSRQTINSLENGRYNPSILLAFKLSNVFKSSIEKIFIYEEVENGEE
ncbi:helix-turn-helix transcriptional regulator [Mycoplasmatota bacterium]|nr:helix-turn-helix transcriptional regulator [Mycoplasmatota bacterium]